MDNNQIQQTINEMAHFYAFSMRTPIQHFPDEAGLEYEEIYFPSMDGVTLEGWFIPANSNKLIICNHMAPGNRGGWPGNIEPYHSIDPVEVNFIPEYKVLHDAGYNVLTYDIRNHGRSAQGCGGVIGNGLFEYRDVIGSIRYAKKRPDTKNMKIGLRSVCMGSNATIIGMAKHPEEFKDILAMVAPQPISLICFAKKAFEKMGVENGVEMLSKRLFETSGTHLNEMSPLKYASAVTVPTLVTQVHQDAGTYPEDVQAIYDALGSEDKKLFWIEGTTRRFDGYNYAGQHPELMLEWFAKYIGE